VPRFPDATRVAARDAFSEGDTCPLPEDTSDSEARSHPVPLALANASSITGRTGLVRPEICVQLSGSGSRLYSFRDILMLSCRLLDAGYLFNRSGWPLTIYAATWGLRDLRVTSTSDGVSVYERNSMTTKSLTRCMAGRGCPLLR
jgi:hypothetical protein